MSASSSQPSATDNYALGIGLTCISIMIFGVQDAVAKVLVQTWSPFQITMMRYWAFGLFSLFLVMRQAPLRQAFNSKMRGWQITRGLLLMGDVWFFALAIQTVPLPEIQTILMLYPLLVTLIAIPVLGERVGMFRIGAVVVGFGGALIILRPGGLPLDQGVFFGLGAVVLYSCYIVCTRKVAQVDSTATSMVYAGVIGMVCSSAVGIWFWTPMDLLGLAMVAVVMGTMVVAHFLMITALRHAPASVVQPFNYLALPWAIILSILIFDHFIDPISLVGAVIVVGAGLVVWARERRKHTAFTPAETTPAGKE